MNVITRTSDLEAFCQRMKKAEFITVDTEFVRTSTYYSRLCLIQVADDHEAFAIDPLADGLDLSSFWLLMDDPKVLKVFHAARQDLEIFHNLAGRLPVPLFDTQVAAMVCGFGDSAGYETLVNVLAGESLDKSIRFTDWSKRPLTERQMSYALSDVTHLRVIYRKLLEKLEETGRTHWLSEEMKSLNDPETYIVRPEDAWKRMKTRSNNQGFLSRVKMLAAWREKEAQKKDTPRNRVLRDEALLEIAAHPPKNAKDLVNVRSFPKGYANGKYGYAIMDALTAAENLPEDQRPQVQKKKNNQPKKIGPVADLLKLLLKIKCHDVGVAPRLIASSSDLDDVSVEPDGQHAIYEGWRAEVFGNDAKDLMRGKLVITADGTQAVLKRL